MEIVFAAGRPDDPTLAHFSFYTFGRWVLAKQKTGMPGKPVLYVGSIKTKCPSRPQAHKIRLLTTLALSRSSPCGFLRCVCFGREKEASESGFRGIR